MKTEIQQKFSFRWTPSFIFRFTGQLWHVFISVCFHRFSGTLSMIFFSFLPLPALSASIAPVPPKLKGKLAKKTCKARACKAVPNTPQNTLPWLTFDSFANSKTRLPSHALYFIQRASSERGVVGGGWKTILDFTEQRPDTSKDSHAPSLSDDKNGWVTPADKGLEPLTLRGEGGLGDRCTEQRCRPTASLDHDLLQSS